MKLTSHRMFGWRTSCLRGLVVILGLIAAAAISAQEIKPDGEAGTEAKLPEVIEAFSPSIVTVTRIVPADGDPANKPVSHAGLVVDPRGYIVIPLLPSQSRLKLFVVRFADQQEVVGELAAIDESLKFGVLKIERPQPVAAVSFAKSREARVDDLVKLVPSPASKELLGGRVTSTTIDLGEDGSTKLIQSDVTFPLSEYGSLIVSELGEPLGVLIASRMSPQPTSLVLPVKAMHPLINAAIDKPQDVPVVTLPASPPSVDLRKSPQVELLLKSGIGSFDQRAKPFTDYGTPVQISLQPATPLAKMLVEHYGPRGARVLDYEEGKRLKIEAFPHVLVELGQVLEDVFREPQKPESKAEPVEPANQRASNTEVDDSQRARTFSEPEEGPESRANAPNIGGMWHQAAEETDRFAIRPSRNGRGFVISSRDDNELLEGNVEWIPEKGRFEGTAMIPKNFKGPIPLVLVPEDGGKKMRVRFSLSEQLRKEMLKLWQEVAEEHPGVHQFDSPKEQEEALIASGHQVWVRDSVDVNPYRSGGPATDDPNDQPEASATSVPRSPRPSVSAIPDTPAAKRLVEQLGTQESSAAAEAATIRQLQENGQAEQNQQPIAEHQRKLKNLLSTAFDLKLQLEELQVKELQSRLSRLERQIGQRKELREKIIARRAGELIEGDTLKWDSTGTASESAAGTTSKLKPTNPTTKPVASSEMTTQVHFTGPKGMEVLIAGEPEALIAPVRHSFFRHTSETQRYDIGFRKGWGDPDVALLDIYPSAPETHGFAASLPATDEFLRHNTVPITITDADTRQASRELLIKVVYLAKPSRVETAIPEIKTLDSTMISPGGDVIAAANQFGTILAVLRLAKNVDQLGKLDPKSSNAAITRPRLPSQEVANGGTVDGSSTSQPSYQEFAKRLRTMNSPVAEAEESLNTAERLVEQGLAGASVVTDARRRIDEAIRNRKAIQDEYAAVLTDLKLQIESAQAEFDAARANFANQEALKRQGAGSQKVFDDSQLQVTQANVMLERLKVRFDLYKKAGEDLPANDPPSAATPKNSQPAPETQVFSLPPKDDVPLDADAAAALILEKLGVKFGAPVDGKGVPSRFRGGLPIVEVIENGVAAKAGFRKEDILVGLHVWETLSLDNLAYALRNPETRLESSNSQSVRAYLVRNGETLFADVLLTE